MSAAALLASLQALAAQARPLLAEPVVAAALVGLGVLLLGGAALRLAHRRRAARAPEFAALDAQVHALAAEGAAYAEIARRTGVSRDAVGLMLRVAEHRQNSPLAAASAAAPARRAPRRAGGRGAQVALNQRLAEFSAARRGSAHALPL